MSFRKYLSLMVILLGVLMVSPCFANEGSLAIDESTFDDPVPVKKKPRKGASKEVNTEQSVEAPAPKSPTVLNQDTLRELDEINARTHIEEAMLHYESVSLRRLEQSIKQRDLLAPPVDYKEQVEKQMRVFPMPGGDPQVASLLGGSKKAMEATLVFPNGTSYEVIKGSVLGNGYTVSKVTNRGVIIEKDGFTHVIHVSSGKSTGAKPWVEGDGEEQGVPAE